MSEEWRTPNEVIEAGIEVMLGGREPDGIDDQIRLMNFICFNVDSRTSEAVGRLMVRLYPERLGLLSDAEVEAIAVFQQVRP